MNRVALRRRPSNRAMLQVPVPVPVPNPVGAVEMEEPAGGEPLIASPVHNRAVQERTALLLAHVRRSTHRRMESNNE